MKIKLLFILISKYILKAFGITNILGDVIKIGPLFNLV